MGAKEEDKESELKKYTEKYLPEYLAVIQKRVLENGNGKFIVGDKITVADFDNAAYANTFWYNEENPYYKEQNAIVKNYPELEKYY